jgi:hypothetical protein
MATVDRNTLEVGQSARWLNHGWVLGVVKEVVKGAAKTMYLMAPPFGQRSFGGASYNTGWEQTLVNADILIDLGPESKDKLSAPNLEFCYTDALIYFKGEMKVIPDYVPQDRNMFAYWKAQSKEQAERDSKEGVKVPAENTSWGQAAKKAAEAAVAPATQPQATVRTRTRSGLPQPKPEPVIIPAETAVRVRTRVRT